MHHKCHSTATGQASSTPTAKSHRKEKAQIIVKMGSITSITSIKPLNEAAVADSAWTNEEDVNAASCVGEALDLITTKRISSVYARTKKNG